MSHYMTVNTEEFQASAPSTPKRAARGSVAVLIAASMALLPIAGCQTIEREFGFNRNTQMGAAGGAAFGGIVAALANANPAWIAASVILGGVAGGAIGNSLGKQDAERHARTNVSALDGLSQGQTRSWKNNKTGNYGSTTVTRVSTNGDGVVCKTYREQIHTQAESVTKEGTACRGPGGSWKAGQA